MTESNNLAGTLPDEVSTLYTLESLELFDNRLISDFPSGISNLTQLKLLDVEKCNFTGELFTESVLSLTELVALRASFNEFIGTIPAGISQLAKLKQLWIAENQVAGSLPTELAQLSSLGMCRCNNFSDTTLRFPSHCMYLLAYRDIVPLHQSPYGDYHFRFWIDGKPHAASTVHKSIQWGHSRRLVQCYRSSGITA